jgi:maltose O-acetyltransferase
MSLTADLAELRLDATTARRWLRRGPLATGPLVPQAARRRLLARAGVAVGRGVSGLERCRVQTDRLTLGPDTFVNARCTFEGEGAIDVGPGCLLGPEVMILTSTHARTADGGVERDSRTHPVRIGARCWLGARALVLPGVTIGDDVVIAAGAVVTADCPSGGTYAGIPARRIR